jgi:hypothetical protein
LVASGGTAPVMLANDKPKKELDFLANGAKNAAKS